MLDPFAGCGSIPLEAQRLGLEAHACDLNPVAVMINKAMIEIPPKFVGQSPVNPEARRQAISDGTYTGAAGMAEDVRYYGKWMEQESFKRIGHLYPKVKLPPELGGGAITVIAWIWARTVKCPNPACGCDMPLVRSFQISKKKGQEIYAQPEIINGSTSFSVKYGKSSLQGTVERSGARCFSCYTPIEFDYIRSEAKAKHMAAKIMVVVAEGKNKRLYFSPDDAQISTAMCDEPESVPQTNMPEKALGFRVQNYGMTQHKDLFNNRQLIALTTFSDLIIDAQNKIISDGGTNEYAQSIGVYLAFVVNKIADYNSSLCNWQPSGGKAANTFTRQAISMTWDYTEANVFSNSYGGWSNKLEWTYKSIKSLSFSNAGFAEQNDAQNGLALHDIMVSTDPPYYDNIGYADLSDFFYIWLRRSLRMSYPELFNTMLVPKAEELIATPFRFEGDSDKARYFFEDGMLRTFKQVYSYSRDDIPVTVYYAFKQSEDDEENKTASTGWETILSAIIQAGFSITGTWPMRMELANRTRGISSNALASTIVLVCRKRPADAPICTRRDFINALKRELKPALKKLQDSNIAPVDLAQSAIGPGIAVYSRFAQVLEADGTPMSVRSALQIINQELDLYFTEQDGELDRDSRFCVDLYSQFAFNSLKFGEADVLARAKNTSVEKLAGRGVLQARKGEVRLLTREEIPLKAETTEQIIWLLTQQLTRAMETGGVQATARIVAAMFGSNAEHAKALAYRLFTIADRKGGAGEAYAYNSLVISWPDVQAQAAELLAQAKNARQMNLFDRGIE